MSCSDPRRAAKGGGRRARRCPYLQEAADLDALAALNRDAYLPDLGDVADRPRPRAPAEAEGGGGPRPCRCQEGVDLYRRADPLDPATPSLPGLAMSAERPHRPAGEGGAAARGANAGLAEAVDLSRELAAPSRPRRLPPRPGDVAAAPAVELAEARRGRLEAVPLSSEAVDLYRRADRPRPRRVLPDLAAFLNDRADPASGSETAGRGRCQSSPSSRGPEAGWPPSAATPTADLGRLAERPLQPAGGGGAAGRGAAGLQEAADLERELGVLNRDAACPT